MPIYAIGDIHGHLGLLQAAHARIAADMARYGKGPIIHLGDLVDRGPDSRGVVDYLIQGIAAGQNWIVLKGNHDRLLYKFLEDPLWYDVQMNSAKHWMHFKVGGANTLASYGVKGGLDRPLGDLHGEALAQIPAAHADFLRKLPLYHQTGDLLFVHAGIRPGVAMADQTEDDLLWIREGWLGNKDDHGALVIHGHTALPHATHYGNRVDIDSSAAYGGPLTAVAIEGREVFVLDEEGRRALPITPDAPQR